ncbi:MAG: alpha-mannosidase [Acidimicrobiia bacterium]
MKRHDEIREEAARLLAEAVEPAVHGPGQPLAVEAHHVGGEPISYEEARRGPFEPFAVGDAWGPAWGTTWFRVAGEVPASWAGEEVVLRLEHAHRSNGAGVYRDDIAHGGESLVYQDGVPRWGMSPPHRAVVILNRAQGGERVDLLVEGAANPALPERMAGVDWPLLRPDPGGEPCFTLARAELAVRRREVYALAADLRIVLGLAARSEDPAVVDHAHEALAAAGAVLDPSDVAGTAGFARQQLKAVLTRPAGPGAPRVSAVGHAHIDTAWLWPLRESVRKCARTFATAVTLMEDFPEYHFVCSAAQHLAWMEERYPTLFARISERVVAGQFGPVGGMWVEADCNVPSGESLVRQIVLGKRFFESRFGIDCTELWLPDAFGYTAALPQIMAAAGVNWFVSQKLSWNDTNAFPHHTFWWEGIDGTRVRAHFPTADTYNGNMSPLEVIRSARAKRSLYPFGYGDGGGGPTREMLEAARRLVDMAGVPKVAVEATGTFFAAVEADPAPLPTWRGDLYLETHRGTFTSQGAIKAGNRRAEGALQAAELWSAAGVGVTGAPSAFTWPAEELEAAWKMLLVNQFHDILPGSGIRWVAEQAVTELTDVRRRADALAAAALDHLAGAVDTTGRVEPVVVFNPTPFARRELVSHDGRVFMADVPALGYAVAQAEPATPVPQSRGTVRPEGGARLSNEHLDLSFDAAGRLVSVCDRDHAREVLAAGRAGNEFHLHEDRPRDYDAWDVDREYLDHVQVLDEPAEWELLGDGRLRLRRRFGASSIDQTVVLAAGSRRVDFVTEVDWHEDHKFLKVAFPVAVTAPEATFEIQFGQLRRPTTEDNDFDRARFEVCAQRWADLSADGFGVALLNDCKYGYDVRGDVLRLSLLRAPTAPDPLCDRGRHSFTYALLPHAGDLAEVVAAGYALNAPLMVRAVQGDRPGPLPASRSFVSVDDPGFVVETVKRADDGDGFVVRGYEALGTGRTVRLTAALPFTRVTRTDLLERNQAEVAVSGGGVTLELRPFELVTLRLS